MLAIGLSRLYITASHRPPTYPLDCGLQALRSSVLQHIRLPDSRHVMNCMLDGQSQASARAGLGESAVVS